MTAAHSAIPNRGLTFRASSFAPRGAVRRPRRGFTLVEMIVVVAIITVVIGIALPAVSQLWKERKVSDTINSIKGALTGARAAALEGRQGQTGLFFFLDAEGVQRVARIHQVRAEPGSPMSEQLAYADVFVVEDGRQWTIPPPYRVAPRYAVEPDQTGSLAYTAFSDAELANENFASPPDEINAAQRHRNFFTLVFSTEGHVVVGRDVLIMDGDPLALDPGEGDADENNIGDRTGLRVGYDHGNGEANVVEYFDRTSVTGGKIPIDPMGNAAVPLLVVDRSDVAINFPSIDGLLVHDDSLFKVFDAPSKRDYLARQAQPMYLDRLTGSVIEGPIGENIAQAKP